MYCFPLIGVQCILLKTAWPLAWEREREGGWARGGCRWECRRDDVSKVVFIGGRNLDRRGQYTRRSPEFTSTVVWITHNSRSKSVCEHNSWRFPIQNRVWLMIPANHLPNLEPRDRVPIVWGPVVLPDLYIFFFEHQIFTSSDDFLTRTQVHKNMIFQSVMVRRCM